MRTDHVYSLTVNGALAVVDHLMRTRPAGGAYTPSRLIGAELGGGSGPLEIV